MVGWMTDKVRLLSLRFLRVAGCSIQQNLMLVFERNRVWRLHSAHIIGRMTSETEEDGREREES